MLKPFHQLPDSARVWIYQANRLLSDAEIFTLRAGLEVFITNWTAHEQPLRASFQIVNNAFVIISVDESIVKASGCSIDKSVNFLKIVEEEMAIELFNRLAIAYLNHNELKIVDFEQFQNLLNDGFVDSDTIVFNNAILNKGLLTENWQIPLAKSWHARLFSLPTFG